MDFATRLKESRKAAELTQKQLAELINAGQTTIVSWEKGENEPNFKTVRNLAKRLGRTPEWLAFGVDEDDADDQSMVKVPNLDVRAMAGDGGLDVEVWKGPREAEARKGFFGFPAAGFRERFGAVPENARVIEVIGDSMEPTLRPGQFVMVNTSDRSPSPPGLFILWDGFGMVIKRVEFVDHSDPPAVLISSDNPRHAAKQRLLGEAYIQGRIVGSWERR